MVKKEIVMYKLFSILSELLKNCGPFLEILSKDKTFIFKNGTASMVPLNMMDVDQIGIWPNIRVMLYHRFKKVFGFDRSKVVFVNGNEKNSKLFIPIGDFDFYWSSEINNLYDYIDDIYSDITTISGPMDEEDADNIVKKYSNKNLKYALESKNEINIKCDEYYLLDNIYMKTILDIAKHQYK